MQDRQQGRRRLWRAIAASALPVLVGLWALWRDVYALDAGGLRRQPEAGSVSEWALLSAASAALVASLWAGSRAARVLGSTFYALLLSVAFAVAIVLAVMHAFGGPEGDLAAPAWALAALGLAALACVVSLLAAAALIVEDVRAAGAEEERGAV